MTQTFRLVEVLGFQREDDRLTLYFGQEESAEFRGNRDLAQRIASILPQVIKHQETLALALDGQGFFTDVGFVRKAIIMGVNHADNSGPTWIDADGEATPLLLEKSERVVVLQQ